jgi:two-component system, OmpR family, sensor histidine kinase KdpD
VVCLSSGGPNSEMLLRYASRLAGRLNRNWYALYVQTPSEEPTVIDAETQRILASALTLAKQLGAMVFTYKGEDVAETILRFAREYRVGHVVVGSPAPISAWNRIRGKKTVVDRLMLDAEGATIVVLDTRTKERAQKQVETASDVPPSPPVSAPAFADLLSAKKILIWDAPVTKGEALYAMTRAALAEDDQSLFAEALPKVLEREQQSSTFFNEGAAFPHARLESLASPRLALGLTRGGIADVTTEKPIDAVFLILTPVAASTAQLQILALASRAAQNRSLIQQLEAAATPGEAAKLLEEWEQAGRSG